MTSFIAIAIVGVIAVATSVEARGYKLISKGHECNGAERFVGYAPSVSACAKKCAKSANMFVYGTNEFGTIRCYKKKGCACYCEDAVQATCQKRIKHTGYNLFRIGAKGVELVEKGKECNAAERFISYESNASACADKCRSSAGMIAYGTNEFGNNRCKKGKCACYCEDATVTACKKRIVHKGYNLYRFNGNVLAGDEKYL